MRFLLGGLLFGVVSCGVSRHVGNTESLYVGRHCNPQLATLRLVTLNDAADSTALALALADAADSASPITNVTFFYTSAGHIDSVKTGGTRSPAHSAALERRARAAARPVAEIPKGFTLGVVRLNRRDVIDVSPNPVTCPPDQTHTPEATRIMREGARFPFPAPRHALVRAWLTSTGQIADAWIVQTAGRPELDSLALAVVHVLAYKPALVGRTPVGTLLQVPIHF